MVRPDFDLIRRNALAEGISLSEITIVYENLSDEQFETLNSQGLIVSASEGGGALGRFAPDGGVLFPEMAVNVLYLGA